jgi:SAM-dependent methyltransferase
MDYIAVNKETWNKRTKVHLKSKFYDVEKFLQGQSSLNHIELKEVGDVNKKSLLHLQCHFGQDTLSWARIGAEVTGLDLSSEAIHQAEKLAQSLAINANFICDDVIQFGKHNRQQFDFVYTSYGVLCWLENLDEWAATVSGALKQGGQFNLVEFHPFNDLVNGYSYFPSRQPDIEQEGTYTENCDGEESTVITWPHSMSEVLNALIKNGIEVESFNEYPFSPYDCFEGLEPVEGKGFQLLRNEQQVPLVYAIKGRKL